MEILVVGYIALDESLSLYEENIDLCKDHFSKSFNSEVEKLKNIKSFEEDVNIFTTSSDYVACCKYGIHRALWDMKEELETGFEIDELEIPVLQETIEILEFFDKDYFDAKSDNTYLIVSDKALDIYFNLKENNIPVKIVGRLIKGHAGNLMIQDRTRHMSRPKKMHI